MADVPFKDAQNQIVSLSIVKHPEIRLTECYQASGVATPSFVSTCLSEMDKRVDRVKQETLIRDVAGTMYGGEFLPLSNQRSRIDFSIL